ncbi:MAG: PAS domain S-box protein [Syntrophotaleaceae bacterium]
MIAYLLLITSMTCQAVAAFYALRLVPVSRARWPWILLTAAMAVRFFREGISLWLVTARDHPLSIHEESTALVVSLLLLLGTALMKPLFLQLRNALAERELLLQEARQARQHLEEEHLRLRAVIDHLPVGIFIMEEDGRIAEVNEAGKRIWGGEAPLAASIAEYSAYKGWWVATGEPVKPDEWAAAKAIRLGQTTLGEAIDIERRNGTRGTILNSAVPIRSPTGKILGAVVVNQDVTQLRRLQKELEREHLEAQQKAAELEAIFHAMPDGLIIYNREGQIVRSNQTAEQITGFSAMSHHLSVQERWQLVTIEKLDGTPLHLSDIPFIRTMQGEEVRGNYLVFRQEGRRIFVSLSAAPIVIDDRMIGVAATFTDITRIQELQEQQRMVVQMISHDLRTPLAIIQGYAEILKERSSSEEDLKSIAAILYGCAAMTRMMESILDIARLEHGHLALETRPVDPSVFLTDLLQRHTITMDVSRLRLALPAGLPLIQADPGALERILVNLLTNALKYSTHKVRISARRMDEKVRFSIADRGGGIEAADLPRIFDPFFRANLAAGEKGLGLGLYISRLLVEAQKGRLWAVSRLGKGTVFFFTIPIVSPGTP